MLKCLKWVFICCLLENSTRKPNNSRLKNLPAGYVGSFYRNLADNVDHFLGSDFYRRIANDSDIPSEDVQKYILATSDFAKGRQTDINHYVEDEVLEQIKEEYNFDEIKNAFDEGTVPQQLDFFYGGENSNFNRAAEFLSLSNNNKEFIAFLLSDLGQNLMTNNSLSIHIENGDIFSQNFNTGENFCNFLMIRQPLP